MLTSEQGEELCRLFVIGKRVRLRNAECLDLAKVRTEKTPEEVSFVLTAMLQIVVEEFTAARRAAQSAEQ
jgi:hypothetical protein